MNLLYGISLTSMFVLTLVCIEYYLVLVKIIFDYVYEAL